MTIFRCAFWLAAAILADLFIAFLLSRGNKQTGDQSDEAYDDQHGTRETPISEKIPMKPMIPIIQLISAR